MSFVVACYQPKNDTNVGTLFRSAYLWGASYLCTIGRKYSRQSSDTVASTKHIDYRFFLSFEEMCRYFRPHNYEIIGIEMSSVAVDLRKFEHPKQAVYVMGNEVYGLPPSCLAQCDSIIQVPTVEPYSLNVAVAGSLIIYDRFSRVNGVHHEQQCPRKL